VSEAKMASLGYESLPSFLINCLILQESSSNVVGRLQMMGGAEPQIEDLDLLVRYSLHLLLNFSLFVFSTRLHRTPQRATAVSSQ
jgi:hypothetical protein